MAANEVRMERNFPVQVAPTIDQDVAAVKRMMTSLDQLYKEVLRQDVDYGVIPGTPKPTLLKPGAEKVIGMMNCAAEPEVVEKIEDYEKGFFAYTVRVNVISRGSGVMVGSGLGACNSREKRYKNQDPYSLQNTILKMAEKRAKVSAALGVGMASERFTQDLEEDAEAGAGNGFATPKQVTLILRLSQSHLFTDAERKKAWAFCDGNPHKAKAQEFIDRLTGYLKGREEAEKKAQEARKDAPGPEAVPEPTEGATGQEAPGMASFLDGIEKEEAAGAARPA